MMSDFDSVPIYFNQQSVDLLNFLIAFIMFGVALDLKTSHFTYLLKNKKLVWMGLVSQFLLLPLVTFLFVSWVKPVGSIALGLILVAACPGGNVSNFAVHLAKGNTALSITLTSLATFFAALATPLNFTIWAQLLPNYEEIQAFSLSFFSLLKVIFLITLLPLLLGMLFSKYLPKATERLQRPIKILSFLIFFSFIGGGLFSNKEAVLAYLPQVIHWVVIHNLLLLILAFALSTYIFRLNRYNSIAITLETGMQNTGLAFVVIFNFMGGNAGMLLIAAFWGIWHLISGLLTSLIFRSWQLKKGEEN
jgi:bile acid:Na+ symporter, BASS family